MDKAYSIKKRTTGFWFFSRTILDLDVLIVNAKERLILEKLLHVCSTLVPGIRYLKSETSLVFGLRGGLKRPSRGSHNDEHDIMVLHGYINSEFEGEYSEDKDKTPFCHTLSSRFDSFDTEKNTILYSIYSDLYPAYTGFKERISIMDTIRNASFELEQCKISIEKFLFSNIISRWCNIPTIDLSIHLSITSSSVNLRIELDPRLHENDSQVLTSLLEVISEYLLSNGQESFYPDEVLKIVKS